MNTRKEKKNLKISNDHGNRKKVVSPKLDLLRPANQNLQKKTILGENKGKNTFRILDQNYNKVKAIAQFSQRKSQSKQRKKIIAYQSTQKMKLKEIQRNYRNNFEDDDNQCQTKRSTSRRSISWRKISNQKSCRRLTLYNRDNETIKRQKPIRYQKFAFRSQKYSTLNSQAKTITNNDYHRKIMKLNEDIDYYKSTYVKSLKSLKNIQKIMDFEKGKFDTQKKFYQDQIRRLKNRIYFKKPNIGHIYCYKQFPLQKLIPQTLILQRNDQNFSDIDLISFDREQAQRIFDQYLAISDNDDDDQSQQLDIQCLSIQSK